MFDLSSAIDFNRTYDISNTNAMSLDSGGIPEDIKSHANTSIYNTSILNIVKIIDTHRGTITHTNTNNNKRAHWTLGPSPNAKLKSTRDSRGEIKQFLAIAIIDNVSHVSGSKFAKTIIRVKDALCSSKMRLLTTSEDDYLDLTNSYKDSGNTMTFKVNDETRVEVTRGSTRGLINISDLKSGDCVAIGIAVTSFQSKWYFPLRTVELLDDDEMVQCALIRHITQLLTSKGKTIESLFQIDPVVHDRELIIKDYIEKKSNLDRRRKPICSNDESFREIYHRTGYYCLPARLAETLNKLVVDKVIAYTDPSKSLLLTSQYSTCGFQPKKI
jgi:hypothetical protein